MKRHLHCAEKQASPSNLTKYIAPATQNCAPKSKSNLPETGARPTRASSGHVPSMNSSSRTRPFAEVTFRNSETHFVVKVKTFCARLSLPKFQLTLRLPRKVTLQHFNVACATTSGTATSLTAASATKKELQHDWTGYCAWPKK